MTVVAAVVLEDVHKRYDTRVVLSGLDLRVHAGEIFGLLGPNGSGKSTTIRILTGLTEPDAGTVRVLGLSADVMPREALGVVPQEVALYPHLTVVENLRFIAGLYGLRGSNRTARLGEVMETFDLLEYRDAPVSTLSGGWQRRVNIAAGVVHRPSVLILDEPTAGLDIEARADVQRVIRALAREGAAVLLTSHLFDEMGALSDRVGILHGGTLVREGTVAELTGALDVRQVAYVESSDPSRVRAIANRAGWSAAEDGGRLAVALTRETDLVTFVGHFHGVRLRSVALQPVTLAHAYLEAVAGSVLQGGQPVANSR